MGTLNLLRLVGGFVADAKLGLGVTLLTLATTIPSMRPPPCTDPRRHPCVEANGRQLAMLYTALYTIALGGGGIKSNVSGFGSDQFDSHGFGLHSRQCGEGLGIRDFSGHDDHRGWGVAGRDGFVPVKAAPGKPPDRDMARCLLCVEPSPPQPDMLNEYYNATVPHSNKLRCLDKALRATHRQTWPKASLQRNRPVIEGDTPADVAKGVAIAKPATVTQVEEVKMVLMLLPIWSTCILFWTVYSQMNIFTIEQATFMNRNLGGFEIPAGSFSFFLFITILLFRVLVPLARRMTHTKQGLSSLQRVGIGLVFSIFGMEMRRRDAFISDGTRIRAFWLVPQFFLVGAGEAFAYVGQLEFFIREVPERMKSMSTGLATSSVACSSRWHRYKVQNYVVPQQESTSTDAGNIAAEVASQGVLFDLSF
ncbi:hypothetical protein SASPL_124429 [Salvia splendens]|uniref:Solute carrier family 15 (Peptide/histidine transporter), member 3/4 n=1 Tax=Salvia splendens TaxID=180675 RepID=A0A8X8XS64_SALSN|nr:hypothetical protein SASPL_124429 [Salvia splendens]